MSKSFENRVALVTGGSTGIGAAVAKKLAEKGARVIVTGRHEETLRAAAKQHPNIESLISDIANPKAVAASLAAVKSHGRLDILVNNAGVAQIAPIGDASPEHVREMFEINVFGLIETTRLALPLLRQSKGTIVNVSSVAADHPVPNMSAYSATKAAIVALTRSWAQELAADGIRVNVVSPGPIETPILSPEKLKLPPQQIAQLAESLTQRVPMRRFGTVDEVAHVVAFLASAEASFVNGAQYTVGGGMEA
jgi:NAD(P)-dependent dehydrogenase (short-subunit alcohol dehydrogenase family)